MEKVIREAVHDILRELGYGEVDFAIEHPKELSHGDYATNVAMAISKREGKESREIAEQLLEALSGTIEYVDRIEVAGPGFINFFLAREFFAEEISRANDLREAWGKNALQTKEEVILEYTSPNLFKPLHVGNLVGNIVGESLARLFEYAGANVRRVNYPSDIGLTVAKGVWGLMKTGGNPEDINALGEAYRAGNEAYEADGKEKEEIESVNRALYAGTDAALNSLREKGIVTSRARIAALCKILGTRFDAEIFESEAGPVGTELVRAHMQDGIFEESDGAVVFKGEKRGLHTRVFLTSQGLPTYEAKDIGNFKLKQDKYPAWTQSFVVTGNEQTEYFKVIISAIREVFPDSGDNVIEHIPTGFLTLTTGKMSSRKGNVLTGESLIEEMREEAKRRAAETRTDDTDALSEEIAVAALKYQILRSSIGLNIVFNKTQALSFEGDSGPYLQYTHARIGSVEAKAAEAGISPSIGIAPERPYEVEKFLYRFPEVIEKALRERQPHYIATFLTELAGTFNTFYAQEKIADPAHAHAPYKLALARAVKITLKNGLWVLGIKAPERM